MRRGCVLALLVLPLLAVPVGAEGLGYGFKWNFGVNANSSGSLFFNIAPLCPPGCGFSGGCPPCTGCPPCGGGCGPCGGCNGAWNPGPGGVQLAPWYQYWPLEAHFNAPAVPSYPYWPAPQGLPPGYGGGPVGPGGFAPPGQYPVGGFDPQAGHYPGGYAPAPAQYPAGYQSGQAPYQPAGYQGGQGPYLPVGYQGQAPGYWYGR
jgi:hypothetical protein